MLVNGSSNSDSGNSKDQTSDNINESSTNDKYGAVVTVPKLHNLLSYQISRTQFTT
jgi:hypothetical protein